MAKSSSSKSRANNRNNKKRKLGLKPSSAENSKQKQPKPIKSKYKPIKDDEDPIIYGSSKTDPDPEPEPEPEPDVPSLLEPFTKPQLITFLLDAALSDPELRTRIRSIADAETSHRNIFVHSLSWDTTKEFLIETFSKFGPIEDCKVVLDKNTGRPKGYAFILFKTSLGAAKALKEPQKMIKNRLTYSQLASVGSVKQETSGRKIYVSNVGVDIKAEKLREFFAQFGEIELGPFGFDAGTGKSKGYAIFLYKNQEDAKRVLDEPFKTFEGRQLHCKLAAPGGFGDGMKTGAPQVQTVAQPVVAAPQQSVFAAVAAAQHLAMLGQNPTYAALLAQNPLLTAAAFNPALMNYAALGGVGGMGFSGGGVGYGGGGGGGAGLLGGYPAGSSSQGGQTGSGQGGAFGGFPPSFVWIFQVCCSFYFECVLECSKALVVCMKDCGYCFNRCDDEYLACKNKCGEAELVVKSLLLFS